MLRRRLQQFDPIVALTVLLVVAAVVMLALAVSPADGGVGMDDSRAG